MYRNKFTRTGKNFWNISLRIKLSQGNLLKCLELGRWFRHVKDPILLEFLKVWGRIEVEGYDRKAVKDELEERYEQKDRRFHEYKGYFAEVHMSQVLLNAQNKTLPGKFFNSKTDIIMPWRFIYVRHRVRLESGRGKEIDIFGAAGSEKWVCQSKWITGKKIGIAVLKELKAQGEDVRDGKPHRIIRMWIFAHNGLTKQAEAFAKKHGILWSKRKEFDELLEFLGLRKLPDL